MGVNGLVKGANDKEVNTLLISDFASDFIFKIKRAGTISRERKKDIMAAMEKLAAKFFKPIEDQFGYKSGLTLDSLLNSLLLPYEEFHYYDESKYKHFPAKIARAEIAAGKEGNIQFQIDYLTAQFRSISLEHSGGAALKMFRAIQCFFALLSKNSFPHLWSRNMYKPMIDEWIKMLEIECNTNIVAMQYSHATHSLTGKPSIHDGKAISEQYINPNLTKKLDAIESKMEGVISEFTQIKCAAWVELLRTAPQPFFRKEFNRYFIKHCTAFAKARYNLNIKNQLQVGKIKERNKEKDLLRHHLKLN